VMTSLTPHMHVRGKDMTYIAHYPTGRTKSCSRCRSTTSTGRSPTS
jgi:hypothetical protein